MSVTMTRGEREQFLAGVHVGVLTAEHWLTVDYGKVHADREELPR
jgi:hypothetical protein